MKKTEPTKYLDDVTFDNNVVKHIWKRVLLFTACLLLFYLSYFLADYQFIGRYIAETQGMPNGVAYYSTLLMGVISITLIGVGLVLTMPRTRTIAPYLVLLLMLMAGSDYRPRFGLDEESRAAITRNPVLAGTNIVCWYCAFHNQDPREKGMPRWMEMNDHMRTVVVEKTDELKKSLLK